MGHSTEQPSTPQTLRCLPSPTFLCSFQLYSSSPLERVRGRVAVKRKRLEMWATPWCPTTITQSFPPDASTTASTRSKAQPHPNFALKKVICQLSAYLTQQQQ